MKISLIAGLAVIVVALGLIWHRTETFDPACCHHQCHGGCHMVRYLWHEFKTDIKQ